MPSGLLFRGDLILPNRVLSGGGLLVREGRIAAVGKVEDAARMAPPGAVTIDAGDGYLSPGYIDLHVHRPAAGRGGHLLDSGARSWARAGEWGR